MTGFFLGCVLWLSAPQMTLRSWLDGPVSIILSEVEKKAYAQLRTDRERQQFIDAFWQARDPNPQTQINEFREEFNSRVETANTLFGGETGSEGWRTERGRMYVLLGAPATRAQYRGYGQIRPIELWFYSGKKEYPQLPSFFYVMFFQRDEIGDFRRYSPFMDQPSSLVKASINSNRDAYTVLANINQELARASLSLIPGEPIDTTEFSPSMTSDVVLAQINQIPKRDFERIGLLRELVNVKLQFGGTTSMTLYPFMVDSGTYTVDVAIDRPPGLGDAKVETVILLDGKEQGRTQGVFSKDQPLIGRLVLKPGEYVIESKISRPDGTQPFSTHEVLHLKPARDALSLSDVLFFRAVEPVATPPTAPFTYRGYQFKVESRKRFRRADRLQVLFQVQTSAKEQTSEKGRLSIDYTIAAIGNAASRWTFHDRVDMTRFDANGLLLNSKTMSIRDVPPGRYFLIILATDPAGHRTSQTVSFEVNETSDSDAS